MYQVISVGDTTIDVFLEIGGEHVRVVDENKDGVDDLVMDFGTKIIANKFTRLAAVGNAANNAIGSQRLGMRTAIYTVLGDDVDSADNKKVFEEEGVSCEFVVVEPGTASNFSAVINVKAERTILVYHVERKYQLPVLPKAEWLYYTSLGKGHEGLNQEILDYCARTGTKLAYQPGSHQLHTGLQVVEGLIKLSSFLVMNKEEAQGLLEMPGAECPELVRKFGEMTQGCVVITDGPKGSFASDGEKLWFCDIYPIEVVERTGCGDGYATGFMVALAKGKGVSEAMKWGTVNAAGVLRFIGAREGLLNESEIEEWLAKLPDFGPKEV